MNWLGAASTLTATIGAVLVVIGLYRRDPAAQRRAKRIRAKIAQVVRKVLRRPTPVVSGEGVSVMASARTSGSGVVRPGERDPDANLEQRLTWLEDAADTAFRELDGEAKARNEGDRELSSKIDALWHDLRSSVGEVRKRLDEAKIPERYEWWGALLVLASIVLGFAASVS